MDVHVTWWGPEFLVLTAAMSARAEFSGYQQVVVPDDEAYAANVLWVNGTVLMPDGFPLTRALLERLGVKTVVLNQSEVEKMDDALTYMSVRFQDLATVLFFRSERRAVRGCCACSRTAPDPLRPSVPSWCRHREGTSRNPDSRSPAPTRPPARWAGTARSAAK